MIIVVMTGSWNKTTNHHRHPIHHLPSPLLPREDHHLRRAWFHLNDKPSRTEENNEALMGF
jgi:hypothetical protein